MGTIGLPDSIPNKYTGPDVNLVPIRFFPHRPVVGNKKFPVGQFVILSKTPTTGTEGELWYLSKFLAGNPIWLPLSSGDAGPVISLSDTAGTLVFPTLLGNIQLEGTAGITVTSDVGNNKLVFSLGGGGGTAVDSIAVDASTAPGTNPVLATAGGLVTITGGQIANAGLANVIRTNSLAANTFTIEVQQSALNAVTDTTKNGVAHFNSTHFTIGANAFISSQIATTAQIGIVTLASQTQSEYNTYGTTQVLQSGNIVSMFAKPPPIGSTAPNTGAFTTLIATSSSLPTGQVITTTAGTVSQDTPLQLTLRSSGTPSAGFGCTLGLYADNSVNVVTDQINLSGIWDVATSGAEVSHAQIQVRSGGTQNACINFYFGRLEMEATTDRIRFGAGGVDMMSGLGSPNGVVTAAKGSFYLRTDGSSTSTRAYINTDGAMAWTAVTTAT